MTAIGGCEQSSPPVTPPAIGSAGDSDSNLSERPDLKIDPAIKAKVAALIEKLKDKDRGVRESAAWTLGEIGPAAKDAVPALIVIELITKLSASVTASWRSCVENRRAGGTGGVLGAAGASWKVMIAN